MTATVAPAQQQYLTAAMNNVSRSFALVVPCIEEPLRDYFATAYLLCRVVDNKIL
jgi:phytoene/squalene synthetase